jgi:hypothetical protein
MSLKVGQARDPRLGRRRAGEIDNPRNSAHA